MNDYLVNIVKELADRNNKRTEADIQAGIRDFLLQAPLDLADEDLEIKLEAQLGDRRRIDIELGSVVIEVKKDLRTGKVLADAIEQLSGYVEVRTQQTGQNSKYRTKVVWGETLTQVEIGEKR